MAKKPQWMNEHERLWDELVPSSGRAETLQGELIRIAGKLTDQAYRSGNGNWNAEHERMWRFVADQLDDGKTFSAEQVAEIYETVETIIRDQRSPDLSGIGSTYYRMMEWAVEWCLANPEPVQCPKTPKFRM